MKDSSGWIRQPMVDAAADEIVAEGKFSVATINAYQVAARLGCEPNGSVYAKLRDWRRRRQSEAAPVTIDVPPEEQAEFSAMLERMTTEASSLFVRTVQRVGSIVDRSAALRIADAERRREQAETETTEVLQLCEKAEDRLDTALARIAALEQALADGELREERLAGRIEQRNADWATRLRHGTEDEPVLVRDVVGVMLSPTESGPDHDQPSLPFDGHTIDSSSVASPDAA